MGRPSLPDDQKLYPLTTCLPKRTYEAICAAAGKDDKLLSAYVRDLLVRVLDGGYAPSEFR